MSKKVSFFIVIVTFPLYLVSPASITKLNIPDNYTPLHAVLLGYSDNTPSKAPKRKENTVNYVK